MQTHSDVELLAIGKTVNNCSSNCAIVVVILRVIAKVIIIVSVAIIRITTGIVMELTVPVVIIR